MSTRIESLSTEQHARMADICQKWVAIGLCTEPADRPSAERAIAMIYSRGLGFEPPRIYWCGSPRALGLANSAFKSIGYKLWEVLGHASWAPIWDAVAPRTLELVENGVKKTVGASAGAVGGAVWNAVRASGAEPWQRFLGQHEYGWLAFYDFFREVCGLQEQTVRLEGPWLLARSASAAIACERVCWLSERPCAMHIDPLNRLHCTTGPAIVYPDGWSLYFWQGSPVPEEWIQNRHELDPRLALDWHNVEQRRVLAELVGGWERVLAQVPTRIIQQLRDASIGTLIECDGRHGERYRFLRVRCGTGRSFVLPVPLECETARQANAWTYGLQAHEYMPEVRT
jgi:hypothetical protein